MIELTTHLFISRFSDLPVPEIVAFDRTEQNSLGNPYMTQRRLPGSHVAWLYQEMSHQNRCRLARELGDIFRCLTSLRCQRVGPLTASIKDLSSQPDFNRQALDETGPMTNNPFGARPAWRPTLSDLPMTSFIPIDAPPYQGSFEALIEIFKYRNKVALAKTPVAMLEADYMQEFITMI
jgi:hypothetical protein